MEDLPKTADACLEYGNVPEVTGGSGIILSGRSGAPIASAATPVPTLSRSAG